MPLYSKVLQHEAQDTQLLESLRHKSRGTDYAGYHCYCTLVQKGTWQSKGPSIWTERIPRSRSCWLLLWARIRNRSAASRGMLNVTRTLFQGSTFCTFSLLDSWSCRKENNIINFVGTRGYTTKNKTKTTLGKSRDPIEAQETEGGKHIQQVSFIEDRNTSGILQFWKQHKLQDMFLRIHKS